MKKRVLGFMKRNRFTLLVLLLVLVINLVASLTLPVEPDEEIYGYAAKEIKDGTSLFSSDSGIGRSPVMLYPLAVFYMVFGTSFITMRVFSFIFTLISTIVVFFIGKEILNEKMGAFAAVLFGILPFSIRYNYVLMSEPVQWSFLSLFLLFLVLGVKKKRWYYFVISSLFVVLAIGVRRSSFVVPIVMLVFFVLHYSGDLKRMLKYGLFWFSFFGFTFFIFFLIIFFSSGLDWFTDFINVPDYSPLSRNQNSLFALESTLNHAPLMAVLLQFFLIISLFMLAKRSKRHVPILLAGVLLPVNIFILLSFDVDGSILGWLCIPYLVVLLPILRSMKLQKEHLVLFFMVCLSVIYALFWNLIPGNFFNLIVLTLVFITALTYFYSSFSIKALNILIFLMGLVFIALNMKDEPTFIYLVKDASFIGLVLGSFFIAYSFSNVDVRIPNYLIFFILIAASLVFKNYVLLGFLTAHLLLYSALIYYTNQKGQHRSDESGQKVEKSELEVNGEYHPYPVIGEKGIESGTKVEKSGRKVNREYHPYPVIGEKGIESDLKVVKSGSVLEKIDLLNRGLLLAEILIALLVFVILSGYEAEPAVLIASSLVMILLLVTFRFPYWVPNLFRDRWTHYVILNILNVIVFLVVGDLLHALIFIFLSNLSLVLLHGFQNIRDGLRKVPRSLFTLIPLLVIGLLLFYYYRGWKEVYLSEFIVISVLTSALVLYFLLRSAKISRYAITSLVVLGLVISVTSFSGTDFFEEEDMDNRVYVSTIVKVGNWIEDNSEKDDLILAWPYYAIQADRENIIKAKASTSYNIDEILRTMNENDVVIFVQDHYLNSGVWEKSHDFENFIKANYEVSKTIDGNVCWLKKGS